MYLKIRVIAEDLRWVEGRCARTSGGFVICYISGVLNRRRLEVGLLGLSSAPDVN